MKFWTLLLAGFAFGTVVVAEEDIWAKAINNDTNGTWNVIPDKPRPRYFKVEGVPGEHAYRIKATKGANPWDIQANSPINAVINEGDVVMLMFYARAAEPAEGGSSLTARIQGNSPPWTATMDMTTPITGEWASYCAHRVATATLPESSVSIQLATAKQVIELGPVFVFNFGKGYPENQLKGCDG
ncbi:MAG TPA: carbohydrate binding domain-containing protein [Steroidobacteraceae bacterium]|nr:carbohydrate binding domain-containing protein [Steroidobacteraceae bacterium]